MTDVFISYSRTDSDFVRRLFDDLNTRGREAWVDWKGIDTGTDWWKSICEAIEDADNFVLIVSQDALNSVYCHREIEHARKNNKQIIPFIYKPLDENKWKHQPLSNQAVDNWNYLKTIQWVDYADKLKEDLNQATTELLATVDTDRERKEAHRRLLQRIRDWETRGCSPSALLRGDELIDYEDWLAQTEAAVDEPRATDEQRNYIAASRSAEDESTRQDAQRERRIRQFRLSATVLSVFLLIAGFAGVFVYNQAKIFEGQAQVAGSAQAQSVLARDTSIAQAVTATKAQGEAVFAQQTAIAGANVAGTRVYAGNATLGSVNTQAALVATQVQDSKNRIESLRLAALSNYTLSSSRPNAEVAALLGIRALNTVYSPQAEAALRPVADQLLTVLLLPGHSDRVNSVAFSPDGRYALTGSMDRTAILWDVASGTALHTLAGHSDRVNSVAFSPDGRYALTGSMDRTAILWDVASGTALHP